MEYTLDQALTKGIEFHKIKDYKKANYFYKKVLKLEPLHSYANHNSGIVCLDTGKVRDSIEFFRIALKSNPNYIQFWISYINALIKLKKINEAEKVYKRAQELGAKGKVFENLGTNLLNIKSNIINLNKVQKKGDPSEN